MNDNDNDSRKWIDFNELKRAANVEAVLSALGLLEDLVQVGEELKGQCPFHKGEGNAKPFSFHETKKAFYCHVCKRKGNVLEFVKLYLTWKNKVAVGVREAAEFIDSALVGYVSKPKETPGKEAEEPKKVEEALPLAVLEKEREEEAIKPPKKKKSLKGSALLLNQDNCIVFTEACRMVSLGQATVDEFVAVKASTLKKLQNLFFTES